MAKRTAFQEAVNEFFRKYGGLYTFEPIPDIDYDLEFFNVGGVWQLLSEADESRVRRHEQAHAAMQYTILKNRRR